MSAAEEVAGLVEEREEAVAKRQAEYLARTLRVLKLGLGKLWKRQSVTITEYDPSYKVAYLGNVLTGWAKGEGCAEKPVGTLWRNYCASSRADVSMTVTVSAGGLRAVTREHGLTEYWSHRITFCAAPPAFPRVFCWVYRHEGRRLKQELRCHAVLCSKASVARNMATQLQARLGEALREFKRDKLGRQQARLSLANAVYAQPSLPRRRILLSTGAANYRPPLERSKSAPKLGPIDEISEEESVVLDEEDEEEERREGGSLSSESGVVLPSSLNPSVSCDEEAALRQAELAELDICSSPSALPEEDSDESGYDEDRDPPGYVQETRVSFRETTTSSAMKRKSSGNRKIKNQVSFSDEISESSDDNNDRISSINKAQSIVLNTDKHNLNNDSRILPLNSDKNIDDHDDSLSENSFENVEILSEYIPTSKYSKLPNNECNSINNIKKSNSESSCLNNSTVDDDLLASVLKCISSPAKKVTTDNNNETVNGLCNKECGALMKSPTKRPSSPIMPKNLSSEMLLGSQSRLHKFHGATVDSSYVEV